MKERWTEAPDGGLMRVVYNAKREGRGMEEKFRGTSNECFAWLHTHGTHSISYETTYGYYTVEPIPLEEPAEQEGE